MQYKMGISLIFIATILIVNIVCVFTLKNAALFIKLHHQNLLELKNIYIIYISFDLDLLLLSHRACRVDVLVVSPIHLYLIDRIWIRQIEDS